MASASRIAAHQTTGNAKSQTAHSDFLLVPTGTAPPDSFSLRYPPYGSGLPLAVTPRCCHFPTGHGSAPYHPLKKPRPSNRMASAFPHPLHPDRFLCHWDNASLNFQFYYVQYPNTFPLSDRTEAFFKLSAQYKNGNRAVFCPIPDKSKVTLFH